jgi:tetrahydromethanopterin S-methyltransferase subunit A
MHEEPDYKDAEVIEGKYDELKDWVYDPKGYFLIRVNQAKQRIEAGYCKQKNKILKLFYGKRASDIYFAITEAKLVSRLDHAAYLGKELAKAEIALNNNLPYVQDEELKL